MLDKQSREEKDQARILRKIVKHNKVAEASDSPPQTADKTQSGAAGDITPTIPSMDRLHVQAAEESQSPPQTTDTTERRASGHGPPQSLNQLQPHTSGPGSSSHLSSERPPSGDSQVDMPSDAHQS